MLNLFFEFAVDNTEAEDNALVTAKFLAMNGHEKLRFLLGISYELTVVARDISASCNDQLSLRTAVGMSEINHKILSYVLHAIDGEHEKTFPADELLLVVLDMISGYGLDPWRKWILGS